MKPLYQIVVVPKGQRYNNRNESGLIMNATIDEKDFSYTNRIGIVVEVPMIDCPFKVGDEVLVHHNVFRQYWGFNTRLKTSGNDLNNGTFAVPRDSTFAYRRDGGDWVMTEDWILVEPKKKAPKEGIVYDLRDYAERRGTLAYGSVNGLEIGDEVSFRPWSEYEFRIDDKRYYKMRQTDITCKIF